MGTQLTVATFSKDLAAREKAFSSVLPAHVPVKKFMRTVVGAVQNNPDILKCTKDSIFQACQFAAQDGLIIDGREAALGRFKNTATYMPMVKGILKKLRNSGQLSSIAAEVVHKNDKFSYNPGTGELIHEPDWFGDRGEPVGVYARAVLKDGATQTEVMSKNQIAKVRAVSRSKDNGPWKDWEEQMWRKSVLRRLCNYLPSSADLDQMWEHDDENFDLGDVPDTPARQSVDGINSDLGVDDGEVIEGEAEQVYDEANPPPITDEDLREGDPI